MTRFLTLPFIALSLSACDGMLDRIEGKESPYKTDHDRRALLITPAAEPECHEVFRVTRCVDGGATEWVM